MKEMQKVKSENCPEDICISVVLGLDRRFIEVFTIGHSSLIYVQLMVNMSMHPHLLKVSLVG